MLNFIKVNLIFNELRDKFSRSEKKKLEKSFTKKKSLNNILKNQKKRRKKGWKISRNSRKEQTISKKIKRSLSKSKNYYDYDDPDYKGIRDIENLFDEINEDYYKSVKTKSAFNGNYIEYESRGDRKDRDKNLSEEEYLDMIRPYLRDMINNHKAPMKLKVLSGEIIDDDSFGESKIHLTMQINVIFSLDTGEIRTMDSKSDNIEIMMGSETDDIIDELFKSFLQRYQEI